MFPALDRIIAWLKQGYPTGIPEADVVPLLALLSRRLSDDEIRDVGHELERKHLLPADRRDVAAAFLKRTEVLPSPDELARVGQKLETAGWPLQNNTWEPPDGPPRFHD